MKTLVEQFLRERLEGANITPEGKLSADVVSPGTKDTLLQAGKLIVKQDKPLYQELVKDNDQGTTPDLVRKVVGPKNHDGVEVFLQNRKVAEVDVETDLVKRTN